MEKIDGVTSVAVSLNEGTVTLGFAPDNRVSLERIRETIRSNGFTPREAELRVTGQIVVRGDSLVLAVQQTGDSFVLEDAPDAVGRTADIRRNRAGATITVSGQVPAEDPQSRSGRWRLLVRATR